MISNPPMLILDEATSSVDTLTEQKFRMLLQMMTGRTSFVIAASAIKSAEKILVMDNGQVVEIGTHDELLQKNRVIIVTFTKHSLIKSTIKRVTFLG